MRKPHLYKTGDICTKQVLSDETAGALLSKVRHATSVQNRLADQRRNVRQRIPRVKRTRRFPTGGQINADRVLGTPWHSVFTFPAGL